MEENNKVYSEHPNHRLYCLPTSHIGSGFTISLVEWEPTIPTLWSSVKGEDSSQLQVLTYLSLPRICKTKPRVFASQQFDAFSV